MPLAMTMWEASLVRIGTLTGCLTRHTTPLTVFDGLHKLTSWGCAAACCTLSITKLNISMPSLMLVPL